jgi:hypothetical protein
VALEEITSPELVLVSPPELAAQAREALPDYELEYEEWIVRVRAAVASEAQPEPQVEPETEPEFERPPEPDWERPPDTEVERRSEPWYELELHALDEPPETRRLTLGAFTFTVLAAVVCLVPLLLLLLYRT